MGRDYEARRLISERSSVYNDTRLSQILVRTFDLMCNSQEPDGCLSTSIALQVILCSIGYAPKLRYGLCITPEGHEIYHAWLEMDETVLDLAIYGNSHFSPYWMDSKVLLPVVFESYQTTVVQYHDHVFDEDWGKSMISKAVQMGSVYEYIRRSPGNGMWKLVFRILDQVCTPERIEAMMEFVSKEPL